MDIWVKPGRNPQHAAQARAARERLAKLSALTTAVCDAAKTDATVAYWVADDYLRVAALALLGWAWAKIQATPAADEPDPQASRLQASRWSAPNAALQHWVLPEFDMRAGIVQNRLAEHRTNALAS